MIKALSPAKVNLHLTVLRKREDGYHDLATLMQKVSLCDEMTFSPLPGGIIIKCPGSSLPEDEGNIVFRAAKAFFSYTAYKKGITITIKKKIPLASGLGGGSSNAATALLVLNEMTGSGCSGEELLQIGKTLGADVPFFIYRKTAAWATGIGDRLQEAPDLPKLWFLLVNPGFPLSTKTIYDGLNLRLTKEPINYSIPRFDIRPEINLIKGLKNDLEEVTLTLHPFLDQLKEFLLSCGALGSLMSGSGPTVFGIFETEKQARKAKGALIRKRWEKLGIYVAHSL